MLIVSNDGCETMPRIKQYWLKTYLKPAYLNVSKTVSAVNIGDSGRNIKMSHSCAVVPMISAPEAYIWHNNI